MDHQLPRKLTAILHTDVVGYSRLMGEDEDTNYRKFREYLDLISELIPEHHGIIVNYAGDELLAEFNTATGALSCAVAIQKQLADRNRTLPDASKVQFRIGINLGEVIVDRENIYGDGVNVAARLETMADPGGICVSESVRIAVGKKLGLRYEDLGRREAKNISEPIHCYKVVFESGHSSSMNPAENGSSSEHPPSAVSAQNIDSEFSASRRKVLYAMVTAAVMFTWTGVWMLLQNRQSEANPLTITSPQAREETQPSADPQLVEPEMVSISAGSFQMGSPEGEVDREDTETQHYVEVDAFHMAKFETTFEQYDLFAKRTIRALPSDEGWGRGQRPVINVSWHDATAYAHWLSEVTGKNYRLPTEAEWEYAARAGTTTKYYFGDTITDQDANYNRSINKTTPVGKYPANNWVLYDMLGNAGEWTCSLLKVPYDGSESRCADSGGTHARAIRGGTWFGPPRWQRSAARYPRAPSDALRLIGFRVVRDD